MHNQRYCFVLSTASLLDPTLHHTCRSLQKTLLKFFVTLMERLAGGQASFDPLALIETLCQCLDVAGSPNYYDLPVLENSLQCLLHLTARYTSLDQCLGLQYTTPPSLLVLHSSCMSRISTPEWMALFMKLMTSLRQVWLLA